MSTYTFIGILLIGMLEIHKVTSSALDLQLILNNVPDLGDLR